MAKKAVSIIRLDKTHVKQAAGVLSRALQEDPVFTYCIPDAATRKAKSHYIFETLMRYCILHGEAYATSGFECVDICLPHHKVEMNLWNLVCNGGLSVLIHLGLASVLRLLTVSKGMCTIHKQLAPYPHKYGFLIGVEPSLQGQGYASPLLNYVFAKMDSEGVHRYLESTNEKNLALWEHYGFKVIKEYQIPKTQIRIWAMLRKPGSKKS